MERIAEEVAATYSISVADLKGADRRRPVAWPRQEAYARCFALREKYGNRYSKHAIGRFFGGRDHSTIYHGIRAHEARQAEAGE
jgi:chromosomal replication initiator protein